jgi:hypothetical protein
MEALAVVFALTKWKDYLQGQQFLLQTDNRSLTWLMGQPELWGRLARWVMFLQRFSYAVEHIPGKSNVVADALSRTSESTGSKACSAEDLKLAEADSFFVFPCFGHVEDVTEYPGATADMTLGPTLSDWLAEERLMAIQGLESEAEESTSNDEQQPTAQEAAAPPMKRGRKTRKRFGKRPPKVLPTIQQEDSEGEVVVVDPTHVGPVMDMLPEITGIEQRDDADFRMIWEHLSKGKVTGSNAEQFRAARAADDYIIDNGRLWKIWIDMSGRRRRDKAERLLAVPRVHRAQLLKVAHDARYGGGHFDYERTYAKIRRHFVWPKLARDVKEYCDTCDTCQRRNASRRLRGPLEPVQIPTRKWDQIGMDMVGPLPETPSGNKCVMVVVDYLSRYPEAVPLPNQEATTIAQAFVNKIVSRWGVPKIIITDQGSNFTGNVLSIVYKMLGIRRNATTPNHPQSDGLVERFNRTLKSTIYKLAADFDTAWDMHIDWAVANYRFALNAALQDTPFFMMTGQDPRLPMSTMVEDEQRVYDRGVTEWRSEFFQNMQLVAKEARTAIQAAQAEMKMSYDRRAAEHTFVPGDLVLLRGQSRRPGRKLEAAFSGPYRVLRQGESSGNVVVIAMVDGTEKHINIAHLRRYRARPGDLIGTLAD